MPAPISIPCFARLALIIGLFPASPVLALGVQAFFPPSEALHVCPDTPMKLTFATAPVVGSSGTLKIHTAAGALVDTIDLAARSPKGTETRTIGGTSHQVFPVLVSDRTVSLFPHRGSLGYGTTYHVTVEPAVFPGITGPLAWSFTTKAAAPVASSIQLTIAADGSGDFCTVQGALDWVPSGNTTRRFLNLRNGTYQEIVRLSGRHNLVLRGEDRRRTVVSYPNHNNLNPSTATRALCNVAANDITFENLSLTNSTPAGGSQAEALRVNGQRCVVVNCDLRSHQDTLLVNSSSDTAYLVNTLIEGDVDYIWGSGRAVFQGCEIRSVRGGYVCQMRTPSGQLGAVFLDCRFTCVPGVTGVTLNRIDPNRFPASAVALVNCSLDAHVSPAAWLLTATGPTAGLRFWEWQSTDASGAPAKASGRAPFSSQIPKSQAAQLRDLPSVFGGWNPVPGLPASSARQAPDTSARGKPQRSP